MEVVAVPIVHSFYCWVIFYVADTPVCLNHSFAQRRLCCVCPLVIMNKASVVHVQVFV
jgi:hypothetical protein